MVDSKYKSGYVYDPSLAKAIFQAQPQIEFKIGDGDPMYIDDSQEGLVVVRKIKNDQPILILPASIAHEFLHK